MADRWHALIEGEPPVDHRGRNDNLWLYNAEGADVVLYGGYDERSAEQEKFTEPGGRIVEITHWAEVIPGEEDAPAPPAGI